MNKKIEDAAKEYLYIATKKMYKSPSLDHDIKEAFKSGAEWALREAIEICKGHTGMFSSIKESATAGTIKEEIEQLLSSEGEK